MEYLQDVVSHNSGYDGRQYDAAQVWTTVSYQLSNYLFSHEIHSLQERSIISFSALEFEVNSVGVFLVLCRNRRTFRPIRSP